MIDENSADPVQKFYAEGKTALATDHSCNELGVGRYLIPLPEKNMQYK